MRAVGAGGGAVVDGDLAVGVDCDDGAVGPAVASTGPVDGWRRLPGVCRPGRPVRCPAGGGAGHGQVVGDRGGAGGDLFPTSAWRAAADCGLTLVGLGRCSIDPVRFFYGRRASSTRAGSVG